ncbi:right-handed parallel beta-helix repeat-containing protein [Sphingobium sp. AP49]|uniref:right-handed parallel beta-helix repeat-containing protein n=1 Tax=Sphingobium sp. AP49 TaxID=1144307 RepID=UPI00026ED732|nr:right-handed parallel beta-helix repeat-containing protein [Sphingobium sp. AP49]WHO39805.1 right-handed parallel beta-helix repeat-containing protein [Sphingobium sp. AP49]
MILEPSVDTLFSGALAQDESLVRQILERCALERQPLAFQAIDAFRFIDPAPRRRRIRVNRDNAAELLQDLEAGVEYLLDPGRYRLDFPIILKSGCTLRGSRSGRTYVESSVTSTAIAVEGCDDITISHLTLRCEAATAIRVQSAKGVRIADVVVDYAGRYAMHVDDACHHLLIEDCTVRGTGYGGFMVRGDISYLMIRRNLFEDIYQRELKIGNYAAAIRIQALEHLRDEYDDGVTLKAGEPTADDQLHNGVFAHFIGAKRPRHVHVLDNKILRSRSQGIYLSGSLLTHVRGNMVIQCDKEGICVDHQSCFNLVEENFFTECGGRFNQTEEELRLDHIDAADFDQKLGAKAKLPAVSIDYSDMNSVSSNRVIGNYGGGIKAVRSAQFNLIAHNYLSNNARGDNDRHVFAEMHMGNSSSEGTKGIGYRKNFDNRNFGSSFNFLFANELIARERGFRVRPTSIGCIFRDNRVFGARRFDYFIENDGCHTLDDEGALVALPEARWPPFKDAHIF